MLVYTYVYAISDTICPLLVNFLVFFLGTAPIGTSITITIVFRGVKWNEKILGNPKAEVIKCRRLDGGIKTT